MCKKQTSVSHSSTEAEIISLDAGLHMDGIPALTLWDLVIEVFHSVPKSFFVKKQTKNEKKTKNKTSQKIQKSKKKPQRGIKTPEKAQQMFFF